LTANEERVSHDVYDQYLQVLASINKLLCMLHSVLCKYVTFCLADKWEQLLWNSCSRKVGLLLRVTSWFWSPLI